MKPLTPTDIIEVVCRITRVSYGEVIGTSRQDRVCDARMIAAALVYEMTDATLNDIAGAMRKARSSVQEMFDRLEARKRGDAHLAITIDACWLAVRKVQRQRAA